MDTIKSLALDERPREKLINKGRDSLSNSELLAIIIGSGSAEKSAIELSREILADSDNDLNILSRKSIQDFLKYKGIGVAKAVSIYAALEIARRKRPSKRSEKSKINCSRDSYVHMYPMFADLDHEQFHVMFLNRGNQIIGIQQISKGGLTGTVADGRIIFQKALETKSTGIILAHNHPSGQLKPSESDIRLTNNLLEFGKMIELHVLDHLIITDNNYFSFADEGLLI
ncbi:MAG: DNA repair protein RadC [Crocinitomicaceae bacterium]|nr:DNA repair protein RadC [Crocinitomicaceae bacterium]